MEQSDASADDQRLPRVYDEWRKLATAKQENEKSGPTLQATALARDVYIQLVDVEKA